METEAKAKVIASVKGQNFIQFLAALPILLRAIWKKRMNSTFFVLIDRGKTASAART